MTYDLLALAYSVINELDRYPLEAVVLARAVIKSSQELRDHVKNDPLILWCQVQKLQLEAAKLHISERWQWRDITLFPQLPTRIVGEGGFYVSVDVEILTIDGNLFRGCAVHRSKKDNFWIIREPDGSNKQVKYDKVKAWRTLDDDIMLLGDAAQRKVEGNENNPVQREK